MNWPYFFSFLGFLIRWVLPRKVFNEATLHKQLKISLSCLLFTCCLPVFITWIDLLLNLNSSVRLVLYWSNLIVVLYWSNLRIVLIYCWTWKSKSCTDLVELRQAVGGVFVIAGFGLARCGFGPCFSGWHDPKNSPTCHAWAVSQARWTGAAQPGGLKGHTVPCLAWAWAGPCHAGRPECSSLHIVYPLRRCST